MIRINLISEGKKSPAVRSSRLRALNVTADNIAIWGLVTCVVLGILVYGGWWFSVNRTIEGNRAEIADLQQTVDELAAIIREVEQFEARKAELEHKIDVIGNLRNNQRGPVHIMDQISRALPEFLWLDRLQLTASAVTLQGKAFTTTSVANFIESLDIVEEFREPVLRNATWRGQVYDFQLVFNYVPIRGDAADEDALEDADAAAGEPAAR